MCIRDSDWSTGVYNPDVEISRDTTTLYASDRDVFLFLVDDHNPIEAGRLPDGSPDLYFRGFYCWNSEVGAKTLGMASFYLRAVCPVSYTHLDVYKRQPADSKRALAHGPRTKPGGAAFPAGVRYHRPVKCQDPRASADRIRLGWDFLSARSQHSRDLAVLQSALCIVRRAETDGRYGPLPLSLIHI